MEKIDDPQTRTESKTRLVERINSSLRSGDYSRAQDLLRGAEAEFPKDAQLSDLEKRAQDGVRRVAEANRLITESQDLFAQRRSAEAIQALRKAYDLDKNNALAVAILANALVEQAHSLVENDWLEAEKLTNQALGLNPTHPTAKTILSLIVDRKKSSSVEDWAAQARKHQSSGDIFGALAWVAEGLAVHPDDPKLQQIQDGIQRDQGARRRQARRQDLDDLRRMAREIDGAADAAAKQALAERIQGVAARYWTDGEILSIANTLLLRLGMVPKSSNAPPLGKGAPVIFHVPRPSAPNTPGAATSAAAPAPVLASPALPDPPPTPALASQAPASPGLPDPSPVPEGPPRQAPHKPIAGRNFRAGIVGGRKSPASVEPRNQVPTTLLEPPVVPPAENGAAVKPSSRRKQPANLTTVILLSATAGAIILVAATFFFARKHPASPVAQTPSAAQTGSAPAESNPASAPPAASAQTHPELSAPALNLSSDTGASSDSAPGKATPNDQPPAESPHKGGALLVVTGQDGASISLNGNLQPQLTHGGQLRLPNLELKDYVVQVSKGGFQDAPAQKIRIRNGQQSKLVFNLQPQPQLASLAIQGGDPGTTVLVDQSVVGTIRPDGTLLVSTVNPGDHTVELRKERFNPRPFKKRFVAGETISLSAADAALAAAPASLKITFTPADATVAISKGELPTVVSSGVPLNLAAGTYTLTARTADRFTRFSTFDVIAGQSKTLNLSLAPNGMSKWEDPGAWKQEKDAFLRKGEGFVLYGVVPASGTFSFSAMLTKGRILQWVLNYTDAKNYVLFQLNDNSFSRAVIRNGQKTDEIKVADKGDKKTFRTLRIRVSPTELVHQIKHGDSWPVVDRWTQPGADLSRGKFGFYLTDEDQVALSGFTHYADLNLR